MSLSKRRNVVFESSHKGQGEMRNGKRTFSCIYIYGFLYMCVCIHIVHAIFALCKVHLLDYNYIYVSTHI